jgi:glutamate/tyrosine decarboxylase-like PLP-dependent enzyme
MATFEMSSIMTLMEKRMANHLLKLMGISDGEGIMVTGGSNSNLLAMLCARTQYNPSIRQDGHSHNRFRIYVSSESHYSFDKAANICGIGTQNLIQIPCTANGQMIPEKLHQIIKSNLQDGLVPLMVGATCGTTVLGAFDPLNEIAEICKKYHIWFHADAAWGGAALLNPKHRSLISGIEKADSVGFDAHKTLGTPLMTSFFLTPHQGILKSTNRGGGAEYLFHDEEQSHLDTGTYSLQCGRRADILKLWFLWRAYGNKGIIERTNRLFDLHQYATDKMKHHSRFIVHHSSYLNLCFQVVPINNEREINQFTLQIRQALLKSGKAMINYATRPDGTIFFRLVFPNHLTTKSDIDVLLNIVLETANSLEI